MQRIRSVIFIIGWYLNGLLVLPVFWFIGLFGNLKFKRKLYPYWSQFSLWWLKVSCGVTYKVDGLEHFASLKLQPSLVLCKHQSTFETFFMPAMLPQHAYVLKRELFLIPFFGWMLLSLRSIGINRSEGSKAFKDMIRKSKVHLAEGTSIMMFPEGTRVKPGDDSEYKMGAFALASILKIPIIPISHNAGLAWGRGKFLKNAGTIHIVIGAPILTQGIKPDALMLQVKTWIEAHSDKDLAP